MIRVAHAIKSVLSIHFLKSVSQVLTYLLSEKNIIFLVYSPGDIEFLSPLSRKLKERGANVKTLLVSSKYKAVSDGSIDTVLHPYMVKYLKAAVLLSTSTGLDSKSFPLVKAVVHVPHSIVSFHMIYPERAFLGFDYVVCVGPHHTEEIEKLNKLYKTDIQPLDGCYPKMETLGQKVLQHNSKLNEVLIAPSWGEGNLLESSSKELIGALLKKGYEVTVRPHPHFFIHRQEIIEDLNGLFGGNDRFRIEESRGENRSIFTAGVLVSDYSGIAFEFAFLRNRPVVFVDVPKKVFNPNYEKVELEPIEIYAREEIGVVVRNDPDEIAKAVTAFADQEYWPDMLQKRDRFLYNIDCEELAEKVLRIAGLKG